MHVAPPFRLLALAALVACLSAPPARAEPAARDLFGAAAGPAQLRPDAIGFYAKGCLAGGTELPTEGPTWQVMRLSRNRNWGHPALVQFLEAFSAKVPTVTGWPGILVGDMAQPRGGPMKTGHASHQVGLDADVWLTPMPRRVLGREEREQFKPVEMVAPGGLDVDRQAWTPQHTAFVRAAAMEPRIERIFVNPAIKKELCREAGGDRAWLSKVRPMWGHTFHMHLRLACVASEGDCEPQAPPPPGDGCGKELDAWFTPQMLHPKPGKPKPPLMLAQLPAACRAVLEAR